ncbi:MAG: hypothetical protein ACO1N8_03025 [Methylophilus sp.]
MLIFFDTEFSSLYETPKLISIGLITEDGKQEFYAELSDTYKPNDLSADGHEVMKHFHKPEDEKRSIAVLNKNEYLPWLNASTQQAKELLYLNPDNFLISEAAPR